MSGVTFTDAALTSVIRRIIVMPGMCSDGLLAMADAISEAARSAHTEGQAIMRSHADDLRRFARYFADAPQPAPARPAAPTPLEAALILIRAFKPSEGAVAAIFNTCEEYSPMYAMLGLLLTAAEQERDAAEARQAARASA
jgi:hypothetical protein